MYKDFWPIVAIILMAIAALVWGIHGVINRDKINNRANYILSIFQIMGGITMFVFLIVYYLVWGEL